MISKRRVFKSVVFESDDEVTVIEKRHVDNATKKDGFIAMFLVFKDFPPFASYPTLSTHVFIF